MCFDRAVETPPDEAAQRNAPNARVAVRGSSENTIQSPNQKLRPRYVVTKTEHLSIPSRWGQAEAQPALQQEWQHLVGWRRRRRARQRPQCARHREKCGRRRRPRRLVVLETLWNRRETRRRDRTRFRSRALGSSFRNPRKSACEYRAALLLLVCRGWRERERERERDGTGAARVVVSAGRFGSLRGVWYRLGRRVLGRQRRRAPRRRLGETRPSRRDRYPLATYVSKRFSLSLSLLGAPRGARSLSLESLSLYQNTRRPFLFRPGATPCRGSCSQSAPRTSSSHHPGVLLGGRERKRLESGGRVAGSRTRKSSRGARTRRSTSTSRRAQSPTSPAIPAPSRRVVKTSFFNEKSKRCVGLSVLLLKSLSRSLSESSRNSLKR